jgi:hypothetical protein
MGWSGTSSTGFPSTLPCHAIHHHGQYPPRHLPGDLGSSTIRDTHVGCANIATPSSYPCTPKELEAKQEAAHTRASYQLLLACPSMVTGE